MEKVLVTGANGLLGANLVRQFLEDGYFVKSMLRKGADRSAIEEVDCEFFEGEITRRDDVFEAVMDCDYIIHAAAQTSQYPSELEAYKETNIEATQLLVEAAKHFQIKRFVFISTANCFTNGSREHPGKESSGFMPWLKASGYAYSKYLAQQNIIREVKENSFPAIIVNPTFLVGAYDTKPSSGKLLLYASENRILFYPPGGKSFVDAENASKAICNALTKGKSGECYLIAGENLSYKDFFKKVGELTGKKKILIPIPKFLLMFVGHVIGILQSYFSLPLPLNVVNARLLGLGNYFSNHKAQQELALKNININQSIKLALNWFDENLKSNE